MNLRALIRRVGGLLVRSTHVRATAFLTVVVVACGMTPSAGAQVISQRGFIEGRGVVFPEVAPNDDVHAVGDALIREELFFKPTGTPWIQFSAGLDLRANSHDQIEDQWRLDFSDRGIRRPRAAIRRLSATLTAGHLTVDVGKQFIRWARADILNPTDRFAPRDYLNVIDTDFLPVLGVRPSVQAGAETFEVVWVPRFTPSRLPLIDQRWTVLPPEAAGISIVDGESILPKRSQVGVRWRHTGDRFEASLSFYDGFHNLPNIDVLPIGVSAAALIRSYPALRSYGADMAIPTRVLTFKAEAAYLRSPDATNSEYVLYVLEVERQTGEWLLVGGYTGEVVTRNLGTLRFAPDEGLARSIIVRAAYTVDPRRTVAIEGVARQSGDGFYIKGEFSEQVGQHWRVTFAGVGLAGKDTDFLGQYHRNSNGSVTLRYSF
jgi:hypothetical protein